MCISQSQQKMEEREREPFSFALSHTHTHTYIYIGAIVCDLSVLITPVEDYQLPPEALSSKLWAVQGEED
ncbi:hypothetical protein IMY05_013G0069600 [Salix suchowensis]|nr:hypothetical protein IMY05_013G0069600 [Salix suchowensis]